MKKGKFQTLKDMKGITLIALIITIIILIILSGISISVLTGDNGLVNKAGDAKTQTEISEEKEILEQAAVVCMGKNKSGNIEEIDLKNELESTGVDIIKSGSKFKATFPNERQYIIDQDGNVKEKNPNTMEISELYEGASTYFGWDVINYAETLPEELQDTEWQLFYAGPLDGETEERLYLISKGYVKNTALPEKNGVKPNYYSNDYSAGFGDTPSDGIISQYSYGSASITDTKLKKLNSKYFSFLNTDTSTNPNIKAVAYMMDIEIWKPFATSNKGFAEYAIGGPTVELLFTAYNKYIGTSYETKVSSKNGYQMRKTLNDSFGDSIYTAIERDIIMNNQIVKDNPFSVSSIAGRTPSYWIASPSEGNGKDIFIISGESVTEYSYYNEDPGFRPLVLLNSNYALEKTKDTNGNDAFKIVEQ